MYKLINNPKTKTHTVHFQSKPVTPVIRSNVQHTTLGPISKERDHGK